MIGTLLLSLGLGIFTWSFAEYAIHNWVGHLGKGRNEFSREHLAHHKDPHYFAPHWKKIGAALLVLSLMAPLAIALTSVAPGLCYSLSFVLTYFVYEVLHHRMHTAAPQTRYFRAMYKLHLYHHFGSPKTNHGVTSPIWDFVFRSYKTPGQIRVPEKDAMTWLRGQDGEVKEQYRDDYVLIQRVQQLEPALAA
jgi:sterol desaturase/sphingolipid hydroxylase (fatty acid hydroxylase superfamily)